MSSIFVFLRRTKNNEPNWIKGSPINHSFNELDEKTKKSTKNQKNWTSIWLHTTQSYRNESSLFCLGQLTLENIRKSHTKIQTWDDKERAIKTSKDSLPVSKWLNRCIFDFTLHWACLQRLQGSCRRLDMFTGEPGRWSRVYTYAGRGRMGTEPSTRRKISLTHGKRWGTHKRGKERWAESSQWKGHKTCAQGKHEWCPERKGLRAVVD